MKSILVRSLTLLLICGTLFCACACAANVNPPLKIVRGEPLNTEEPETSKPVEIVQPSFVGGESAFEPDGFLFSGRVFLMGDSTMCGAYSESRVESVDIMGWGNPFADYFLQTDGDLNGVRVYNYGASGASSRSYLEISTTTDDSQTIRIYQYVMDHLKAGDYLVIQFGHNDEDQKTADQYTSAALSADEVGAQGTDEIGVYSFEWVLETYYIKPCLERGAVPVLATPIATRDPLTGLGLTQRHQAYCEVMQRLAERYGIPLLDLTEATRLYYENAVAEGGVRATEVLHAYTNENRTAIDQVHLSRYGAFVVAGLCAEEVRKTDLTLARFLLPEPSVVLTPRVN